MTAKVVEKLVKAEKFRDGKEEEGRRRENEE
jgi:hypothetical protein